MKLGGTEDLSRANLTRSGGEKERPSVLRQAEVAIPTDRAPWFGKRRGMPPAPCLPPLPLLRFLRASSGFHEHTAQFQRGLSLPLGIAALAPGSFARAERPGGQKPAGKRGCETAHRPGLAKISVTIDILPQWPWVDSPKRLLAGNNEDAVARGRGCQRLGRPIYSRPGEDNDSVAQAGNGFCRIAPSSTFYQETIPTSASPKRIRGQPVDAFRHATRSERVILPDAPRPLDNEPAHAFTPIDFSGSCRRKNSHNKNRLPRGATPRHAAAFHKGS
ncbi:Uncharacterised protein [Chromobacterium violaceum]|uniref:Uncharacterized protein n=1 Tax=Chromobacterium violaceum TaxID=536 RepID=A0A3S4JTX7_CHRVL|nr:Uncharacterised protein [Chromobacterium violaceum]